MMVEQLRQAKLVLLGEMGSGKTSLVQRYVRGHYYENQVSGGRQSLPFPFDRCKQRMLRVMGSSEVAGRVVTPQM